MKFARTLNFVKKYKKLPLPIKKQIEKQILFLVKDFFHPSLNTKKKSGFPDWWEFRVSKGYRMTGKKIGDELILHTVGIHDEGLGKM